MPCFFREKQRFEIWSEEVQKSNSSGPGLPTEEKKKREDEASELFQRLKKKKDEHIKALEELRKKLRQASTESEKARLRKEIEELEDEIDGFNDVVEKLVEFTRDLERRTITTKVDKK